jgi:hypothetical protein
MLDKFKYLLFALCIIICQAVANMVSEGKGRLFRRKDGKYLVYLPKDLAEDSMFPFKGSDAISVKVSFALGDIKLMVEKWTNA